MRRGKRKDGILPKSGTTIGLDVGKILRSFGFALAGIWNAFKSERNFRVHTLALVIAVGLGLYLRLSVVEWGLVVLSIGSVLAAELLNTALERLADDVAEGKTKATIKTAKDIAAAAVLVSAAAALAIGILVLIVPLVRRINGST